jgi:hypothetical protein
VLSCTRSKHGSVGGFGVHIYHACNGILELNAYLEVRSFTQVLTISQWVYFLEFIVKVLANGLRPWGYFTRSYWNSFDLCVLIIGFLGKPALLIFRMFKLFRVMRQMGGHHKQNFDVFISSLLSFRVVGSLWMLVIFFYSVVGSNFCLALTIRSDSETRAQQRQHCCTRARWMGWATSFTPTRIRLR